VIGTTSAVKIESAQLPRLSSLSRDQIGEEAPVIGRARTNSESERQRLIMDRLGITVSDKVTYRTLVLPYFVADVALSRNLFYFETLNAKVYRLIYRVPMTSAYECVLTYENCCHAWYLLCIIRYRTW
jgi:hypothetical protein